jgi:hypothetical protein
MARTKLLSDFVSQIEADAYRRGFNDALRAFSGAVKGLRPTASTTATESQIEPKSDDVNSQEPQLPMKRGGSIPRRRLRENSDQMRVLKAIRETPGMRGIEIVRTIEAAGQAIHERTVRTALSRLKGAGMIEQREEKWYEIQTGQSH